MNELEALGVTKDELRRLVVERIAAALLDGEEGEDIASSVQREVAEITRKQIDRAVKKIAEETIAPKAEELVTGACLQETNRWGEATGKNRTFKEYLVTRAEAFFQEKVDHNGRERGDPQAYNWAAATTRVSYMVHEYLRANIENAMKSALATANKQIVGGLEAAVKMSLEDVLKKLRVKVEA